MSKKQLIGIQNNMIENRMTGARMDMRGTAEVETTRFPHNKKPYRNRRQKEDARSNAQLMKTGKSKGTYVSFTDRSFHSQG